MRPRADSLLLWTGGACVYGCGTCPYAGHGVPDGIALADLLGGLAGVPDREGRLAILVGGEPFLRPDVLRLLAGIRAAGCAAGLVTTGRPLLYAPVRDKLRRADLAYLRVQLFGVGEAHDRASAVAGAFAQVLEGVRAWSDTAAETCDVDVALSTRGRPLARVVDELEQLAPLLPTTVQLTVAIDGEQRAALAHDLGARQAVASLREWNTDAQRPLLAWEGLPSDAAELVDLAIAPPLPSFVHRRPPACCLGTLDELALPRSPDDGPRANSFNFIATQTAVPYEQDVARCTAHARAGAVSPARALWLVDGAQLRLHATDTGDFDLPAVNRLKDELSHVFVDRAPAGVLDDYVEGMRRVLPDPRCDACVQHAACGHRFQLVDEPPYAREEAWIVAHLRRLRGRVLDVGCGEQLYRDELAPLLRSGTVDYHGLDPDAVSLRRVREALPDGRYSLGDIEAFRGTAASYDHILCLRALNHVFDMDEAIGRMAELLRPGGQMLLVETTPFAMLRSAAQVAAADRAPRAGHQHFRNVGSEAVVPLARRRGLRVVHHHPIGRTTTNQWILLLERPALP
ncbi:MAG: methyltransferase domain-containing protein [Deltaproteobacteria bacterium]|nr:methyltransferase domain-containing protein [Deltaproteobacteria bacterium]